MTRDEILAELAVQQARIDQANALIETATAAKLAAEADIVTGTNQRADAQTEIVRLLDELATLPRDWDPKAIARAWPDAWGCRNSANPDQWAARAGRPARLIGSYSNARPFNAGIWSDVPAQVRAGEARWLVGFWPDLGGLRGGATPAEVAAMKTALRSWGSGAKDAQIRRAARSFKALGVADVTELRPCYEFDGTWFAWSITDDEFAAAYNAFARRLVAIFAEEDAAPSAWRFNLAGTTNVPDDRVVAALAGLDGFVLSLDDYISTLGDVAGLRGNLARVDRLVGRLPGCVGVGVDEFGPHNKTTDTAALLAQLAPRKVEWVQVLCQWVRDYCEGRKAVPWAGAVAFETVRPNGRPISAVLLADRSQSVGGSVVLPGRQASWFTAANGERVPSNDPEMARAFIEAIA